MASDPFHPILLRSRRDALRRALDKNGLDAILILTPVNSLYLTGFHGSNSQVLVTRDHGDHFLTDFRYIELAQRTIKGMGVHLIRQFQDSVLPDLLKKQKVRRLGFEDAISYATHGSLEKLLKSVKLKPAGSLILRQRMVKAKAEIAAISTAQTLNEAMQQHALSQVSKAPLDELGLQRRMRDFLADHEAAEAFETIVAAGANSSLPHARPSHHAIEKGGYLLLDSGALLHHYHSDMTRTYGMGPTTPRHQEIYQIVLDAQQAALSQIRAGVACRQVDRAARDLITKAGYGDQFGHGTGHGVGLEIHEGPRLNSTSKETLEPGMVVTVEPGIYIPGFGGVRIEDLVVVTEKGFKNLTQADKTYQNIRCAAPANSAPRTTKQAGAKRK